MKIALATADFPPIEGGLSRLSTDLAFHLHQKDSLTGVLAPRIEGGAAFDKNAPYPIHRFSGYQLGPARFLPGFLTTQRFRREILDHSDHLLAINPSFGGVYGMVLRKTGSKLPFSLFAYGFEFLKFEGEKFGFGKKALLEIYQSAHTVLAISRFTRDRLVEFGVPVEKVGLCNLGVDTELFQPERVAGMAREDLEVPPDSLVLLSVGRLIERKRNSLVIEAVARLRDRWPTLEYWIVGRGPEEESLRKLVRKLNLGDAIRFWGNIPDTELPRIYQAADIFTLVAAQDGPSVEGLGLVLQEAAACARPTIGARSGGIPDALVEDVTGLLVPPDDLEALTAAIEKLLGDENLRATMGQAGRRWVERDRNWDGCLRSILTALQPIGEGS